MRFRKPLWVIWAFSMVSASWCIKIISEDLRCNESWVHNCEWLLQTSSIHTARTAVNMRKWWLLLKMQLVKRQRDQCSWNVRYQKLLPHNSTVQALPAMLLQCLPCSLGQSSAKAFLWRCAWLEPGEHSEQNQSTHSPRILHICLLGLSQSYLIIPACLVLSAWFSLHPKILGHSFTELCPSRWFRFIHLQERRLYGQFNDPSHHVCSGFDEQWAWFLI